MKRTTSTIVSHHHPQPAPSRTSIHIAKLIWVEHIEGFLSHGGPPVVTMFVSIRVVMVWFSLRIIWGTPWIGNLHARSRLDITCFRFLMVFIADTGWWEDMEQFLLHHEVPKLLLEGSWRDNLQWNCRKLQGHSMWVFVFCDFVWIGHLKIL